MMNAAHKINYRFTATLSLLSA